MTEHDLMEPGDSEQTSGLSSPPRRDSMEDADSTGTLTRKRPRLDSGSKATRRMSVDVSTSDTQSPGNHTPEPVEVTINVRSHPPSSQPDSSADLPADLTGSDSPPVLVDPGNAAMEDDMAADSPPVVEINLDGDTDDGYMEPQVIEIGVTVREVMLQFPFRERLNGLPSALHQIGIHVSAQDNLEPSLLPQLADWLNQYPSHPSQWEDFYVKEADFWDGIADIFRRALNRRYPLGDDFTVHGGSATDIVGKCLLAYLKTCVRITKIDVARLESLPEETHPEHRVMCVPHFRAMTAILRGDSNNLFRQIQKEFNEETQTLVNRLVMELLKDDSNGILQFVRLAEVSWAKGPVPVKNWIANSVIPLLNNICRIILETPQIIDPAKVPQLCDILLRAFRVYDADLQAPGKILDVQFNRDLVLACSILLKAVALLDPQKAKQLADEFMGFDGDSASSTSSSPVEENMASTTASENFSSDLLPALASNAWKFKLLKKYISKGRMELRVVCISTMDTQLVEIWKEYNGLGHDHPLMQYLADYLLHGKVVDYIIGVDSHPQLISRSGNIVGFLVVTRRFTDKETDAIWRAITHSPDPRVVSAIILMLKQIVNLMLLDDLLAMITKLYQMPIESYTLEVLRFAREITVHIIRNHYVWNSFDDRPSPAELFVRMMQDTGPSRASTKLTNSLYSEAAEQLGNLASSIVNGQERLKIYQSCVDNIENKSPKATGSAHAFFLLHKAHSYEDSRVMSNLDLGRHLVLELCDYVENERSSEQTNEALKYRLYLIAHIATHVPSELYSQLWDHIFGKDAWNNDMRDQAWWLIIEAAKRSPLRNEFCALILSDFIPRVDPIYYTKGLYEFITRLVPVQERKTKAPDDNSNNEVLAIPGANLLWPLVLNAHTDLVVDVSAKNLAARYLEVYRNAGVTFEQVEEAHAALAEECTNRLLSSYHILRPGSTVGSTGQGEPMVVAASDEEICAHERHFTRTLLFAKLFLLTIRSKPEFAHSRKAESACESIEQELYRGEPFQVRFQVFGGASNERQLIVIGKEDTVQELHDRLCRLTGFTKLRFIVGGQNFSVQDSADKQLHEVPGIDWILVSKAVDGEPLKPEVNIDANCSIFETTILNHFEEMYSCMDSEDHISEAMYDFLFLLKPREAIAESVATGTARSTDIFPPGKVFQAKYAGLALQSRLRAQLNKGIVDEKFLSTTIQLLDSALLNNELIGASLAGKHDVPLASVLVNVLLSFLKERPLQDLSSNYFSDEKLLVDRLFSVIYKALDNGNTGAVADCYATILEAFLHSRKVWEAFVSRADFESLHKILLLVNGSSDLRQMVAKSIASVCGGALPSSSPLTASEIASFYWKTISSIVPHSVEYPRQSAQLFDIAEQVLRRNDEYDRDEPTLRVFLSSWSSLLLRYKHEEFVGRDEVDTVVLGFTKLLRSCIQSLKSFKKPLDAGTLMEQTFSKFLFPPPANLSYEVDPNEQIILPVLNSETRKELYELILALAEDSSSYGLLLSLTDSLLSNDALDLDEIQSWNYGIDRSTEIRSSTGYVGLVNPRAICYMNSLLTQLFMNVNFRQFMLDANISDARGSQQLLSETQRLFAQMQNTYRKAADPRSFAAFVKGLDSEPIDINVQMDADEFYNLLFDQWEGQMLSPATKQLFRSFYGGHTVNQIKSKECEHVSERVESFFVIQCDVQGKANLQESLQSFVEGDVMEGDNKYKCESCGGKFVDAVKRTCLKDVPDNLIFHLKRFDFDLIDMRRTKINDYFEFPTEIDVSPYNVDHLSDPEKPRKEDIFELVGVLVHQGNSENGHYYSFIRERPSASGGSQKWLDFNDREVTDFEPSQIAYNAFGGIYDEHFQRQQKPFSAYMLFYQRKSAMDADHQKFISTSLSGPTKVPIPADREISIAQDNEAFVREYCLYDPNHSRFVRQVLYQLRDVNNGICSENHRQEKLVLGITIQHITQVIGRQRDISNFDEIMIQLWKTVQGCVTCCRVAVDQLCSNEHTLVGLLLRCTHSKIRMGIRSFLRECLFKIREEDSVMYGVDTSDEDLEALLATNEDGALSVVTRQLGQLKKHMWIGTRGWDDYFRLLADIASKGTHEAAVMLENDTLLFCLRLFAMHASPNIRNADISLWKLVDKKKGVFNQIIELVCCLLHRIDLNAESVYNHQQRLSAFSGGRFPLTRNERSALLTWHEDYKIYATFDMMIEKFEPSKSQCFWPGEIIKLALAFDSTSIRSRLSHTINEGITTISPPGNEVYIRAAVSFCEACRSTTEITHTIQSVTADTEKFLDQNGEARLDFFTHLPNLQNPNTPPTFFYEQAIIFAKRYAVGLLLYEDESIRRNAMTILDHLFLRLSIAGPNERELKFRKFKTMRELLKVLCNHVLLDYDAGANRSIIYFLFLFARTLAAAVSEWQRNEDECFLEAEDETLLRTFNLVDQRFRNWPLEDDTLSGGKCSLLLDDSMLPTYDIDAYDDSQYEENSSEEEAIDVDR
ncbi:uncharacterized protein BDZ99DRAFT_526141 [Mytilinidion resinicola]|uniref:USP domain-containing protein n=1 Tax=Mytilinidion resinicola TaxID=574789 RepID=A0A6A6Y7E2_9PEZI|nr:uncharacterized protein BDZ99DRAFT_526141 [Mytilinidion resinicola]KAF2804105.1 hypothetical protein BDZ99DRAFT_526141 [Mytilinidion resinicola]